MKHFLITFLLLVAMPLSAQSGADQDPQALYNAEVRSKLALDYSMPDYNTSKISPKVMGSRLATLLQELCAKYKQSDNLSILSRIQGDQIEGLDYCTIEEMKLKEVSKSGNTITILFNTKLGRNPLNIKKSNLVFTFVDGVSVRKLVNSLFMSISRYIKE